MNGQRPSVLIMGTETLVMGNGTVVLNRINAEQAWEC